MITEPQYIYTCEFCNKKFSDKEDCKSHESFCNHRINKEIKRIVCWFNPIDGSFSHDSEIKLLHTNSNSSHIWYELDDDDNERSIYIKEFDKIIDENKHTMSKNDFSYCLYTLNLEKDYEYNIFDNMHRLIKKDINAVIINCKKINEKNFKEYGSNIIIKKEKQK